MNQGSLSRERKLNKLRTQLRETVRAEILNATEALIAEHGVHGAPLAAIAKQAGVAVGTLYNYFADRDAMIAALFEERRATLRPKMKEAAESSKHLAFEPRLYAMVRDLLAACDEHRLFIKVVIETEHTKLAPSATNTDLEAAISQVMQAGVAEKHLRRDQAELASFVLLGAIKSVVLRRAAAGKPCVGDAEPLVAMFLDGVRGKRK